MRRNRCRSARLRSRRSHATNARRATSTGFWSWALTRRAAARGRRDAADAGRLPLERCARADASGDAIATPARRALRAVVSPRAVHPRRFLGTAHNGRKSERHQFGLSALRGEKANNDDSTKRLPGTREPPARRSRRRMRRRSLFPPLAFCALAALVLRRRHAHPEDEKRAHDTWIVSGTIWTRWETREHDVRGGTPSSTKAPGGGWTGTSTSFERTPTDPGRPGASRPEPPSPDAEPPSSGRRRRRRRRRRKKTLEKKKVSKRWGLEPAARSRDYRASRRIRLRKLNAVSVDRAEHGERRGGGGGGGGAAPTTETPMGAERRRERRLFGGVRYDV